MDWRLRLEADGSFREELSCPELTWAWGWDAAGGVCWEVDDAALPRVQELDDREAMLLSVWTRTGAWARVACAAQLTALTGEGAEREGEAALVLELVGGRVRGGRGENRGFPTPANTSPPSRAGPSAVGAGPCLGPAAAHEHAAGGGDRDLAL